MNYQEVAFSITHTSSCS